MILFVSGKPDKRTVFVQHVKTVTSSEATSDALKSLVVSRDSIVFVVFYIMTYNSI